MKVVELHVVVVVMNVMLLLLCFLKGIFDAMMVMITLSMIMMQVAVYDDGNDGEVIKVAEMMMKTMEYRPEGKHKSKKYFGWLSARLTIHRRKNDSLPLIKFINGGTRTEK